MTRWLVRHGPNMAGIVVGVVALYLLVRQSSRHVVRLMARHNHRGSEDDRENRASTLVGVFRYAASLLVFGTGIVMLLDEAGIPVIPLMGGAAVLGLAVAFGAQNLIKDYYTGFMILLEDQYGVNDVVRIDSISGLVERISLRVTALRDQEGTLHFVPHGSITTVSNLTHTWSRALIDVAVSYDADLDQVIAVLRELGHEMRRDPLFASKITDDPEMLGVDALGDSAVTVRFLLRTRPLQQWAVKRELLKRIKKRFDELGISIPYPHRTLLHKFPDGLPPAEGRNGVPEKAGRGGPWAN
jgi:small conductance mechanosensitive channel